MNVQSEGSGFRADGFEGIDSQWSQMSEVRRTSHNVLVKAMRHGQWWMLKGMLPEEADLSVYQEMLRKEFEILVQLQHPNIVRTYDLERVEGIGPCIVMEWVEGQTLEDFLQSAPTKEQRWKVTGELISALGYLHQKNIVHRDLKPSNIMVTTNGQMVKLIDFGLADSDSFAVLKQSGGTEKYMSPEQAQGGSPDVRNDIYSLGLILKQMELGSNMNKIVKRCLKPIGKRYHDMTEVETEFKRIEQKRKSGRRHLWTIMGLTALVCFLLYGASVFILIRNKILIWDEPFLPYVPKDLQPGEEPTMLIENPDFHGGRIDGWICPGGRGPRFYPTGSTPDYYLETFDVYQVLHGIKPGHYELSVYGFHRPDSPNWSLYHYQHAEDKENGTVYSTAELYADTVSVRLKNWASECGTEPLPADEDLYREETHDQWAPMFIPGAEYYFMKGHYRNTLEFIVKDRDSVRIGVRLLSMRPKSLSWVAFDTFRLRRLDDEEK